MCRQDWRRLATSSRRGYLALFIPRFRLQSGIEYLQASKGTALSSPRCILSRCSAFSAKLVVKFDRNRACQFCGTRTGRGLMRLLLGKRPIRGDRITTIGMGEAPSRSSWANNVSIALPVSIYFVIIIKYMGTTCRSSRLRFRSTLILDKSREGCRSAKP